MRKVVLFVVMAVLSAAQLLAYAAAQTAGNTNAVKKVQCKAKTKSGVQCRKSPKAGAEYCARHANSPDKKGKTDAEKGAEGKKSRKVEAVTSASPKSR